MPSTRCGVSSYSSFLSHLAAEMLPFPEKQPQKLKVGSGILAMMWIGLGGLNGAFPGSESRYRTSSSYSESGCATLTSLQVRMRRLEELR